MASDNESFKPAESNPNQEVSGIATNIRLPPLWRDRIRLWFIQFEAIVAPLKKSDQQIYELLIAQLERQDVDEISDILLEPPTTKKVEALKNRLIAVYEESKDRNLQRLLSEMELGDMKPSQLLRRMKTLAADNISEAALRILWSNRLPVSVRAVVAASDTIMKDVSLNDIALMADKILEQTRAELSVISSSTPEQPSSSTTNFKESPQSSLEDKLDSLVREVAELKMQHQQHRRSQRPATRLVPPFARSYSRSRGYMPSSREYPSDGICYYHRRFGDSAFKCTIPCSYKKKEKKEN